MANSDYVTRGAGAICPTATLFDFMLADGAATTVRILNYTSTTLPEVGDAVMVDHEIMRIQSVDLPELVLARGCADTVPAFHQSNTTAWFFDRSADTVGSDEREYTSGETIGVKVLMRTSGSTMETKQSPANALPMVGRAARPYPPAKLLVDGLGFRFTVPLSKDKLSSTLTWVHRDRVLQMDALIDHMADSIGPEPGTTYRLKVFNDQGVLKRTVDVNDTTVKYTLGQAISDLGIPAGQSAAGVLRLYSVRDGLESFQGYSINFNATTAGTATGWGNRWGIAWGS